MKEFLTFEKLHYFLFRRNRHNWKSEKQNRNEKTSQPIY